MAANLYCTRGDVTRRIPLGALTSSSGLVATSSVGANTITLDGHGLETNDPVSVRALEDGALPDPLVAGTTYYARRLTNSTFELAASVDGPAIDLTTAAITMVVAREPNFDEFIEEYSRWADGLLPAHIVPLTPPIHPTVKGVVADCVAKRVLNINGQDSAVVATAELAGKAILERYAAGVPLRGADVTASANLAVSASLGSTKDPRGWGSGRLP